MRIRNNLNRRKSSKANLLERSLKGVAAREKKRLEKLEFRTPELVRVNKGQFLGTLTWQSADGEVRKWNIRQGKRANGIEVSAKGKKIQCGWDKLVRGLRKNLAVPKKVLM